METTIQPPKEFEIVTLSDLKDDLGNPVAVKVRRLDPEALGELAGVLPGEVPAGQSAGVPERVKAAIEWVIASAAEPRFARIESPADGVCPVRWLSPADIVAIADRAQELAQVKGPSFRSGKPDGPPLG